MMSMGRQSAFEAHAAFAAARIARPGRGISYGPDIAPSPGGAAVSAITPLRTSGATALSPVQTRQLAPVPVVGGGGPIRHPGDTPTSGLTPQPGVTIAPTPLQPVAPIVTAADPTIYDGGTGVTLPPGVSVGAAVDRTYTVPQLSPAAWIVGAIVLFVLVKR